MVMSKGISSITKYWSSILRPFKDIGPRGIAPKQSATIPFGTVIVLAVFPELSQILSDNIFDMTSGALHESIRARASVLNTRNLASCRSRSGFLSIFICSICLIWSGIVSDGFPRSQRIIFLASAASLLNNSANVSPQFVAEISASTSY